MQLLHQQLEQGCDHAILQVFLVYKEVLSPGNAPELGGGVCRRQSKEQHSIYPTSISLCSTTVRDTGFGVGPPKEGLFCILFRTSGRHNIILRVHQVFHHSLSLQTQTGRLQPCAAAPTALITHLRSGSLPTWAASPACANSQAQDSWAVS